ncbi:hypothetical protein HK104_004231 [Borealophlyctis nickersoniae]|nr:hypothetical protein HK104_004231 [Borealophlyctis nickersoniae]
MPMNEDDDVRLVPEREPGGKARTGKPAVPRQYKLGTSIGHDISARAVYDKIMNQERRDWNIYKFTKLLFDDVRTRRLALTEDTDDDEEREDSDSDGGDKNAKKRTSLRHRPESPPSLTKTTKPSSRKATMQQRGHVRSYVQRDPIYMPRYYAVGIATVYGYVGSFAQRVEIQIDTDRHRFKSEHHVP